MSVYWVEIYLLAICPASCWALYGIPSPGPAFKALTVGIEDKCVKCYPTTWVWVYTKCPQASGIKLREVIRSTHVHSPLPTLRPASHKQAFFTRSERLNHLPKVTQAKNNKVTFESAPAPKVCSFSGEPQEIPGETQVPWLCVGGNGSTQRGDAFMHACTSECLAAALKLLSGFASFDPSPLSAQRLWSSGMPGTKQSLPISTVGVYIKVFFCTWSHWARKVRER